MQIHGPHLILIQKLWGPATCVLTSPRGDSDACSTLRHTPLGTAWENKNKTKPLKLLGTFEKEKAKVLQDPCIFLIQKAGTYGSRPPGWGVTKEPH